MRTPCWEWPGRINSRGYGTYGQRYAHRLFWEAVNGPVPPGKELHHLCHNHACFNPKHLRPMTRKEHQKHEPRVIATANAAKTHCPQDHEYTPENTIMEKGRRRCRTCRNAQRRK